MYGYLRIQLCWKLNETNWYTKFAEPHLMSWIILVVEITILSRSDRMFVMRTIKWTVKNTNHTEFSLKNDS